MKGPINFTNNMQTFLPYPSFVDSAKALDKRRCWKQVVEAKQIITVLSHLSECPNDKVAWMNHPAVKMWKGHIYWLREYFDAFLEVSVNNHDINTKYELYDQSLIAEGYDNKPWWLGNEDFHRAMRARLIEKDEAFYLPKFPNDKGFNGGKYWWPNMDTKKFYII